MKIRNGFVANSSSSSFIIKSNKGIKEFFNSISLDYLSIKINNKKYIVTELLSDCSDNYILLFDYCKEKNIEFEEYLEGSYNKPYNSNSLYKEGILGISKIYLKENDYKQIESQERFNFDIDDKNKIINLYQNKKGYKIEFKGKENES